MFCTKCGSQNSNNSKFCQKCGSQLPYPIQQEKNFNNLNQADLNTFIESTVNAKILADDKKHKVLSEDEQEKEFVFKSFKAGGASRFTRLTQVICSKKFIKITRNYRPSFKKEPDELINTEEVKKVNYKLNISLISIILIILVCSAAFIYGSFIYGIIILVIGIVFSIQTKIYIVAVDKKYIIYCGTFGGRSYAQELVNFINRKLCK